MAGPTPEQTKRVEEGLTLGMTRELAADYAGVPLSTFYRWLSQGETDKNSAYRSFWEAVKRGETLSAMPALRTVVARATSDERPACLTCGRGGLGEFNAAAWLLERRHGYRRDAPLAVPVADVGGDSVYDPETQAQYAKALEALPPSVLGAILARVDRRRLGKALELAGRGEPAGGEE